MHPREMKLKRRLSKSLKKKEKKKSCLKCKYPSNFFLALLMCSDGVIASRYRLSRLHPITAPAASFLAAASLTLYASSVRWFLARLLRDSVLKD